MSILNRIPPVRRRNLLLALDDCHAALLRLGEAAQTYTGGSHSKDLCSALQEAENALAAAYTKGDEVSLHRLDQDVLSVPVGAIRRNVWLLEEISARYLEVHKAPCWTLYEESASKSRMINDLLSLTIATDVVLSEETSASIRAMVHEVYPRLAQIPYPEDYAVSTRWMETADRALRLARGLRDPRHIAYAGLAIFDVPLVVLTDSVRSELADRCESTYYRNHPELRGIGDSLLARAGTTVMVDWVPYSTKTEQGFFFYREIFSSLPQLEPIEIVIEIGSGFGRLARIMHLANRAKCFVLVDLPESLLFSYAYLKVNFPHAKTHIVSSLADILPDMQRKYQFIFCPVQLLAELRIGQTDLVINTYSFSEMTQSCVNYLMRCIHEVLQPRFLYSMNIMFSQKGLHYSTGGLDGEANDLVLNIEPVWWPIAFQLTPSLDGSSYWISGSAVLKRVPDLSPAELVCNILDAASQVEHGSVQWLGHMYLAALWGGNLDTTEEFFEGLHHYLAAQTIVARPEFNFEEIGEVRYLRKRTQPP